VLGVFGVLVGQSKYIPKPAFVLAWVYNRVIKQANP